MADKNALSLVNHYGGLSLAHSSSWDSHDQAHVIIQKERDGPGSYSQSRESSLQYAVLSQGMEHLPYLKNPVWNVSSQTVEIEACKRISLRGGYSSESGELWGIG